MTFKSLEITETVQIEVVVTNLSDVATGPYY